MIPSFTAAERFGKRSKDRASGYYRRQRSIVLPSGGERFSRSKVRGIRVLLSAAQFDDRPLPADRQRHRRSMMLESHRSPSRRTLDITGIAPKTFHWARCPGDLPCMSLFVAQCGKTLHQ